MKNFQPGGKCGNCYWFRRSVKKDNVVTESADCRENNDPEKCPPEDFMPCSKKKTKKQHKSWEIKNYKSRKTERKFERK